MVDRAARDDAHAPEPDHPTDSRVHRSSSSARGTARRSRPFDASGVPTPLLLWFVSMDRRAFVGGSLAALACVPWASASAQRCPRQDWSSTGALTGREPADPEVLSDEERSHVPVLTLPRHVHLGRPFDLVVQIGLRPHDMSAAHHIDWIEVALDDHRVTVIDLTPDVPYPIVRVPIVVHAAGTLIARARCNQHGVWMTRRALAIG
jgi:superoxide reductase